MSPATEILYGGSAGGGKALSVSEAIPTPGGMVSMGDIVPGDVVLGGDGLPVKVLACTEVMVGRPCYRVNFIGGYSVVCDAGHLWRVTFATGCPFVLTTETMAMWAKRPQGLPTLWIDGPGRRHDISRIEPVESVPVKCIQVDAEDGMFLVGDHFIPTHNSHLMRVLATTACLEVPGLQAYLFRRQSTDLIKNHIEGPTGFPVLLGPLVKAGVVKIVYSPNVEITFRNGPTGDFDGGSKIFICHCKDENNKYNYLGCEFHLLCIDELTTFTESIYTFLRSRLRLGGLKIPAHIPKGKYPRIICGSNPGGVGHGFAKAMFIDGVDPMSIRQMPDEDGGLLRQFIPAKLADNPTLLENDPKYASRLKGLGNEALVKAMLDGDWDVFVGQAFDFNKKYHVVPPRPVPSGATIWMSLDWGYGAPFAVGWFWADGDGRIYMCGEWYGWTGKPNQGLRLTDTELALGIIEREKEMGFSGRDILRYAGHDCFSKKPSYESGGQGPSTAERFAGHGLFLIRNDPDKARKLRQFYERLRVPEDGTAPMFQVYDTCKQTIRTIPTLVMKADNPEVLEDHGAEDHFFDAIGSVFSARPLGNEEAFKPKTPEQKLIESWEQGSTTETSYVAGVYGGEMQTDPLQDVFGGSEDTQEGGWW